MTQEHVWEDAETTPSLPLLQLASEIATDAEATRQRLARKRRRLLAAGVLLAPDDPPEAWIRNDATIAGPPDSYPRGVSPTSGALNEGA